MGHAERGSADHALGGARQRFRLVALLSVAVMIVGIMAAAMFL